MFEIIPLQPSHHAPLVEIWHAGWHDAHAHLVPPALLAYRSRDHFVVWLAECTDRIDVAQDAERVLGFVSTNRAELVKLYVAPNARGTGLAASLLAHAETILFQQGHRSIELYCTAGNLRAQRFYQRQSWTLTHTSAAPLWLPAGVAGQYVADTHRFGKDRSTSNAAASGRTIL
jgi:ribosomal protein S18 acetylase RimI-like enzyme